MKLADLILEFAALTNARLTGDKLLIQRQHAALSAVIARLPDELPEREQPPNSSAPPPDAAA
jgi:hypothetical protein